ncbi:MAG TPA: hypothetical protein VI282_18510 [Verrucomicrobiae bacterium]|jgi:hypothetical protein
MKPKLLLAAVACVVLWTSGCATSALWEEGRFARFHQPAKPSNLELFKGKEQRVLVVYDEENEETGKRRRRAYWAETKILPPENPFRPEYVAIKRKKRLAPIPIGTIPGPNDYSAVATNDMKGFVLYRDGRDLAVYDLPVYEDRSARTKQVALTPLAIVADLTIIGGVLFVYAAAQGGLNGWL